MTRKVNHRKLENPTREVAGGSQVDRFYEVGTLSNPAKRYAAPEKIDRCWDHGNSGEEGEKAEWVGQERLPELESDGVSKARGEPTTRAWQVRDQLEVAWRQAELGVGSVADGRRLEPKRNG